MSPTLTLRKKLLYSAIVAGVLWGVLEVSLAVFARVARDSMRIVSIDRAMAEPSRIDDYLRQRNPLLGWTMSEGVDARGARTSPRFPEPEGALVSVYGDSFAFGSDLAPHETWPERLSARLDRRVANYGVEGYGVDQSVLRFEQNTRDEAEWVVLSIYPDDLFRALSRQVGLVVSPDLDYAGLKPRFELGPDGALTVIPPPFGTRAELERYVADPAAALADDWFAPEGHWARNRLFRFPYTRSLYQLMTGERFASLISTRLAGVPATTPYYRPDHPARMVALGAAIVRRFVGEAERRGKRPLVLLLSEADHYQHHVNTGQWVTQPFMDALAGVVPLVHAGDHLRAALGDRPFAEIASASYHVNPEGAQLIADALGQRLEVELARVAAARTGTITGTAAATP